MRCFIIEGGSWKGRWERGRRSLCETRGMLERRKGRRGSWVLGEIKGKGTHHGSLTDFRVVMFVATVHKVICIAKCGEYSALHALTHLPYTGGSFVTSYFFCCQFVLKSYHPVIQPETSPILNPLLDTVRASPFYLHSILQWSFSKVDYLFI